MKLYEKPIAEVVDFTLNNSIMDDPGAGQGPGSIEEDAGNSPFG